MTCVQEKSCFITGHRPSRFAFPESAPMCQNLKTAIADEIKRLYEEHSIRSVWVGGVAGVDTWAAEIVLELRKSKTCPDIALYMARHFPEHGHNFPPQVKRTLSAYSQRMH